MSRTPNSSRFRSLSFFRESRDGTKVSIYQVVLKWSRDRETLYSATYVARLRNGESKWIEMVIVDTAELDVDPVFDNAIFRPNWNVSDPYCMDYHHHDVYELAMSIAKGHCTHGNLVGGQRGFMKGIERIQFKSIQSKKSPPVSSSF